MSSIRVGWIATTALLLATAGSAEAGILDDRRLQPPENHRGLWLNDGVVDDDVDIDETKRRLLSDADDPVPLRDVQLLKDFHPETDRWTDRNNRIRISPWVGVWFFSNEFDLEHDVAIGIRLNWEVPGFIAIRIDSAVAPFARLEVKGATTANARSSRWVDGFTHSHHLGLGIFNPELSVDGLAFWAGFGVGLWFYDYQESNVFGEGTGVDANFDNFDDINFSGHIFIELDYEITDIIHVSLVMREHIVLASHTDEGRFYDFNGVEQSVDSGRNDGMLDDLALVSEFGINISILF